MKSYLLSHIQKSIHNVHFFGSWERRGVCKPQIGTAGMYEYTQRQSQADIKNRRKDEIYDCSDCDISVFTDIQISSTWK